MGKAALIMDMPERCEECILCKRMEDNCYYCMATNQIIVDVSLKKHGCPLSKMPQRKGLQGRLPEYDTDTHYEQGYNACLDDILRQ